MKRRSPLTLVIQCVVAALLPGCVSPGAPEVVFVGTYIPAWMICALVGIIGAGIARILFVLTRTAELLPHQLSVCTGLGVIVAVATWLLLFR